MSRYFAMVFCEVQTGTQVWTQMPRDKMMAVISEYKYLAESIAGQYGSMHHDFNYDGHLFLFDNADAAVQFAFKLIDSCKKSAELIPAMEGTKYISLLVGCHFGECMQLENGGAWVGRGINLVKRVAQAGAPDTLCVTENVLDVVDLPMYRFQEMESRMLEGDHLPQRHLYQVVALDESYPESLPAESLTAESWFLKGVTFIGAPNENSQEEAESYNQALRLRPDYPEAHNNLAVLLRATGQEANAAEHYREALRLRPDYPEAHYNYAVLLQSRGSMVGAAEHYREALRLRPDYVDAHYGYATLLNSTGARLEAAEHYREALRLRPEYAEVHNNYAILLEDIDEPEKAQDHYREALRIRPEYPEAHYNYAFLLENRGDLSGAETHYHEALRLRPDYAEAHNNLAILLQSKGDLATAEAHYAEALRLRPDEPETHYNFALLMKAKGDLPRADEHFRLAYELAPTEWVATLLERAESSGVAPDAMSIELTPRELEVLRLIAIGKSNREIAQELLISLSTVAHHVTNILNKSGASNRTEAAAYAARHGLVSR